MESQKQLIDDLQVFLQKGHRKRLLLVDYIRLTEGLYQWTPTRKQVLYKAVYATKAVTKDYVRTRNCSYLQVSTA